MPDGTWPAVRPDLVITPATDSTDRPDASSGDRPARYRWVMLALAWVTYAAFTSQWFVVPVLIGHIIDDLSITNSESGLLLGIVSFMYIFVAYPGGIMVDRIGVKRAIGLSISIIAAASIGRGLVNDFASLLILTAFIGASGTVISVGVPTLVGLWFPRHQRGLATGIAFSGAAAGTILAQGTGASLVYPALGGWQPSLFLFGLAASAVAVLWWVLARGRSREPAADPRDRAGASSLTESIGQVIGSRGLWLIVGLAALYFTAGHGLGQWLPRILETRTWSTGEIAILLSISGLIGVVAGILVPLVSDRVGLRRPVILVATVVAALSMAGVAFISGPALWLLAPLVNLALSGVYPLLMVMPVELAEIGPSRAGNAIGLIQAIGHAGGFVGPLAVGYFLDTTGSFLPGLILLTVLLVVMAGLSQVLRETGLRARALAVPAA